MKKGKISESVLKRSVLKYIHREKNDEMTKGAAIGEDCAFFSWKEASLGVAVSTQTVTLPIKEAAKYAVYAAANNLAAGGAKAKAVTLAITLPAEEEAAAWKETNEQISKKQNVRQQIAKQQIAVKQNAVKQEKFSAEYQLKELMQQANQACQELGLVIAGGHTEISDRVKSPVITVTVLGQVLKKEKSDSDKQKNPVDEDRKTGMDIVMTKWIGLEGTAILAKEKEAELSRRYPLSFLHQAQSLDKYLSLIPEAATALRSGVHTMHDMRNGGVFGALWELSKRLGVGLSVDLKKIPVKQETIEICEFYDLNPYEFLSGGSLLLVTEKGENLVDELAEEGIFATVIGQTTDNNDKVLLNEEETRFLEPAKPDEIFKIVFN